MRFGRQTNGSASASPTDIPRRLSTLIWVVVACLVIGSVALLRRRVALAASALATIAVANVATQLLRRILLERPDLIGAGELNSLPSGHATVAASVSVGLVMATAPRWRSTVGLVSVVFPISIGVAVVTAAWHRPSDSIAAFCVVPTVATASLIAVGAVFGFDAGERPPRWLRRSMLVLAGAGAVVLGGLGLIGLWLVRDRVRDGPLAAGWESVAYASSTAGIAAAGVVVTLCLVLALRGIAVGGVNGSDGDRTNPTGDGTS